MFIFYAYFNPLIWYLSLQGVKKVRFQITSAVDCVVRKFANTDQFVLESERNFTALNISDLRPVP